nr:MAG TPA: hypothetical protein [Herelleviridae sp.]
MIKILSQMCAIFFIVLYMLFAFANWDIAWVAHVNMIARWFFILLFVAFFLMFSVVYFENNDKF